MNQSNQSPVRVDAQALADAINKRLGTKYRRSYIGAVRSGKNPVGHPALRDLILEEEARIIRDAADAQSQPSKPWTNL